MERREEGKRGGSNISFSPASESARPRASMVLRTYLDAFVTMRGSWNRNPPAGYKVVRIRYQNGKPVAIDDFITGFLNQEGTTQFGRPVGLAINLDGSLLFTDDANGVIYRVTYTGK